MQILYVLCLVVKLPKIPWPMYITKPNEVCLQIGLTFGVNSNAFKPLFSQSRVNRILLV